MTALCEGGRRFCFVADKSLEGLVVGAAQAEQVVARRQGEFQAAAGFFSAEEVQDRLGAGGDEGAEQAGALRRDADRLGACERLCES